MALSNPTWGIQLKPALAVIRIKIPYGHSGYGVTTLHRIRPGQVEWPASLRELVAAIPPLATHFRSWLNTTPVRIVVIVEKPAANHVRLQPSRIAAATVGAENSDKLRRNVGTILDWALFYQWIGWFVLPIDPDTKKPLVLWKHRLSTKPDDDEICSWWARWPRALVGMATGAPSGVDVVIVKNARALMALHEKCGPLPRTFWQETSTGSVHLFFEYSELSGLKPDLGAGLELKTSGSFAIVAPSRCSPGPSYTWGVINPKDNGLEDLAEWPEAFMKRSEE